MKIMTRQQAKEIDLKATRRLGISALMMMENAGIRIAEFCLKLLKHKQHKKVAVFCGKGNNCGDGLVISRQLICAAIDVDTYLLCSPDYLSPAAKKNYRILSRITRKIYLIEKKDALDQINFDSYDLLIDAIFGIGLKGKVRGIFKETIQRINQAKAAKIVSVDVPSGLDADSGYVLGAAIQADYTVSLIGAKKGLLLNQGKRACGKLVIRQIGFPLG